MKYENPIYFGTESEFAVLGSRSARERFARELYPLCHKHYPMLRSQIVAPDMFLPWGRLYMDAGLHPEWCTAEVTDPWSVVYFQKVGEAILAKIAQDCPEDICISRHNVDCLSHTTWGSHESYQTQCHKLEYYAKVLIPHLVTRTLYTGAGGVDIDFEQKTCRFLISPRANYFQSVVDQGSRSNRPLFHLKDEPLSSRFKRLHLICGENLFSNTANFLRIATTALLIRLTDHLKTMPICDVVINDTLDSLYRLSADPLLNVQYTTKTYEPIRPLDIQWRYLELVYSKLDCDFMPPWARFTCQLWHKTLQDLEKGWSGVSQTLDWAIKFNYLEEKINEWGFTFLDYPFCTELSNEQLYELLECDLSFSKVGQGGLFYEMQQQGELQHRVDGLPAVQADDHFDFPVMGRAAVRANVIERLSPQQHNQYFASWTEIVERNQQAKLTLNEVGCNEEKWTYRQTDEVALLVNALKKKIQV